MSEQNEGNAESGPAGHPVRKPWTVPIVELYEIELATMEADGTHADGFYTS